jgi:hypothetical protein
MSVQKLMTLMFSVNHRESIYTEGGKNIIFTALCAKGQGLRPGKLQFSLGNLLTVQMVYW